MYIAVDIKTTFLDILEAHLISGGVDVSDYESDLKFDASRENFGRIITFGFQPFD